MHQDVEKDLFPTPFLTYPGYLSTKQHSNKAALYPLLHFSIIVILMIVICGQFTALLVNRMKVHQDISECIDTACPDNWIGFQRKCFYFSDDANNWTFSQIFCDSHDADLVQIETQKELNFLLRYKGPFDHWIGLSREQGQTWKWINGTEWTECFTISGGGEYAYLSDKGASSARHHTERKWICSKRYAQRGSKINSWD